MRTRQETGGAGRSAVVSEVTSLQAVHCRLGGCQHRRSSGVTTAWVLVRLPCIISIFKVILSKDFKFRDSKYLRDLLWITAESKRILQHLPPACTTGQLLLITPAKSCDWLILPASCRRGRSPGWPGLSEELQNDACQTLACMQHPSGILLKCRF